MSYIIQTWFFTHALSFTFIITLLSNILLMMKLQYIFFYSFSMMSIYFSISYISKVIWFILQADRLVKVWYEDRKSKFEIQFICITIWANSLIDQYITCLFNSASVLVMQMWLSQEMFQMHQGQDCFLCNICHILTTLMS